MKILHVASFMGNIGDNASHKGLEDILRIIIPDASITRLEIRKFYNNYNLPDKLSFDEEFIHRANRYDLLIIGGGGFLDYWVPDSMSGTTVNMDPRLVSKINVPTWITSVGCVPCRLVPDGNLLKFKKFMDALLSNQKIKVAVRNDGSIEDLKDKFGFDFADQIPEILDHGFFYKSNDRLSFLMNERYVAVNLTEDQIDIFLQKNGMDQISHYYHHLARICQYIVDEQRMKIVFVPHIYSDVRAIAEMLTYLPDPMLREWVSVAPYVQGNKGADFLFSIYRDSDFILATRLHANICGLAMDKPVAALSALARVKYIHAGVGSDCVLSLDGDFSEKFKDIFLKKIGRGAIYNEEIFSHKKMETMSVYQNWRKLLS